MSFSRKLFIQSSFEILTVGLPFCGFKIIFGAFFYSYFSDLILKGLGVVFLVMGLMDLIMNSVNLIGLLSVRRRVLDSCLMARIFHFMRRAQEPGNSIDVLISFSLVAFMVGSGLIPKLPLIMLKVWNACVVINVLGAGFGRMASSLED